MPHPFHLSTNIPRYGILQPNRYVCHIPYVALPEQPFEHVPTGYSYDHAVLASYME